MTTVKIDNSPCTISSQIDPNLPTLDRVFMLFGPVYLGIWDKDDRKAFIAALLKADAELDAAQAAREGAA